MRVKIYVEGGGDRAEQKNRLREGFQEFFKKAGLAGNMPRVVACGSREKAYDRFSDTVNEGDQAALLLVDAEERVNAPSTWQHLKHRDSWNRPDVAADDQCHLMVEVMEAWFLADIESLKSFYGRDFQDSAVRKGPNVESIPKQDVIKSLEDATRPTKKGRYHKGNHSADLLGRISPEEVRKRSAHAKRFLRVLKSLCLK